ncbi:uncharacterized oxidoreductase YjmC-like [Schistocerca americana]|uniref:uncharacterized oxidoreductase YjmC-like n=1 Tax=Schistocerca americana TaxID=7009 RepID=UPI001F4FC8DD|nr:uncharacterized oxidoreductase YjmC-like [Schistocerca americana]
MAVVTRRWLSSVVSAMSSGEGVVVPVAEAHRFMADCMKAVGASTDNAAAMADLLVAADQKGHFSHGMNRLEMYVSDVKKGLCCPNAEAAVLKESPSTAWVDGRNGLGPVVGNFCMQLAIQKAKQTGVGWVVAKGCNHYGMAGFYAIQALKEGMLGMSFTNTSPLLTPTRAKQAALGTNPLSLAAPGTRGDSAVIDMATTAVAVGKIEMQRRKGEPIPSGWALGPNGAETTDPEVAFNTGCLMPLGGQEINSGYKGYGLGLLVEIFCGILSGSSYGPNIRHWMQNSEKPANLGQCFAAIDPKCFAPDFECRMEDLMTHLRNMTPADPSKPVLVPGDPERNNVKLVDKQGGIQYHENQLKASLELAQSLGVQPMKTVPIKT